MRAAWSDVASTLTGPGLEPRKCKNVQMLFSPVVEEILLIVQSFAQSLATIFDFREDLCGKKERKRENSEVIHHWPRHMILEDYDTHIIHGFLVPAQGSQFLDSMPPLLPAENVVQWPGVDGAVSDGKRIKYVKIKWRQFPKIKEKKRAEKPPPPQKKKCTFFLKVWGSYQF